MRKWGEVQTGSGVGSHERPAAGNRFIIEKAVYRQNVRNYGSKSDF